MITVIKETCYVFKRQHPNFTGCVIDAIGDKAYFKNGKYHRENGPAIEWKNGNKYYFKNDELHREDGPAVELVNGHKKYWLNDEKYLYEEWKHEVMKLKLSRILRKIDGNS